MADLYSTLASDDELRSRIVVECRIAAIEFARSIDSTQRRARELAAEGAPEWTVVAADYQSAGRGQYGRRWSAAAGSSVMFSLIVRPQNPEAMALIPIRAGLAAADALESLTGTDVDRRVGLKWPNDLMSGDAKLGGILCEGQVRGNDLRAIVGVGVNVHPFEPQAGVVANPRFLDDIVGHHVDRLDVLRLVVGSIRGILDVSSPQLAVDELARYAARDWLAGRTISEPVEGTVIGIDETGHLAVRRAGGELESVVAGSVRLADAVSPQR